MSEEAYTVVTAAGESLSLFLASGFGSPKNLMHWDGTEVLVRAVKSYAQNWARTAVALNKEECRDWPTAARLQEECPGVSVAIVSGRVPGALVSAVVAMSEVPDDAPLIVAAGDSQIVGGITQFVDDFLEKEVDAGTVVFASENPRWSYVSPGPSGSVRQVAEKRVIGPLATTGVFFYRRADLFRQAAEWCLVNNARDRGIFYVSTTFNFLVKEGMDVRYSEIPRERYQSWSLPIDFVKQSG